MSLNLWKRDGAWYARGRVTLPDGTSVAVNRSTRIEVGPGTRRHAEAAALRLAVEVRSGTWRTRNLKRDEVDPATATVRDAVDAYRRRRDTCDAFTGLLENFARQFGRVRLLDLDEAEIMTWASSGPRLQAAGRSAAPRTVQGRVRAVRAVLAVAESGLKCPVPHLDLSTASVFVKCPKWLTIEERNHLLQAFDPTWRSFAALLFMTGARPVELGRLRWADVLEPTGRQEHGRIILRHLKGRARGVLQWRARNVPLAAGVRACLMARGRPEEFVFLDEASAPMAKVDGRSARLELSAQARAQLGEAFRAAAATCGLASLGVANIATIPSLSSKWLLQTWPGTTF